jgi:hypothetical protein
MKLYPQAGYHSIASFLLKDTTIINENIMQNSAIQRPIAQGITIIIYYLPGLIQLNWYEVTTGCILSDSLDKRAGRAII